MQDFVRQFLWAVLLLSQVTYVFGQTLRIAVDSNYPPYAWQSVNKKLQGVDVALAKALCDVLGIKCQFIAVPWQVILKGLPTGNYDAAIGGINITHLREKQADFSMPYMRVSPQFVARSDSSSSFTPSALANSSIGVLRNSPLALFLQEEYPPDINIKRYFNFQTMLADFHAQKLDYLFTDPAVLQHQSGQHTYRLSGPVLCNETYFGKGQGIAIKKGNTKLRLQLDFAINQLRTNGQLKAILDKNLGKNIAEGYPTPCANTAQTGA